MPTVHITLTDTPTGGVAIHTDFKPAIGAKCSPAQGHALEIMARTHKQWGLEPASTQTAPGKPEVDTLVASIKHQHPQWSWQMCADHAASLQANPPAGAQAR
jgi:hypothetical protein